MLPSIMMPPVCSVWFGSNTREATFNLSPIDRSKRITIHPLLGFSISLVPLQLGGYANVVVAYTALPDPVCTPSSTRVPTSTPTFTKTHNCGFDPSCWAR